MDAAVVTMRVERRRSVEGAAGVVVLGGDGRVVGYQLRPEPAEALSDLVDVQDYRIANEAYAYLADVAPFWFDAIPPRLEQDLLVYSLSSRNFEVPV